MFRRGWAPGRGSVMTQWYGPRTPRCATGEETALRRVRGMTVVAGLVALGLVLVGCGTKPTSSGSSPSSSNSGSGGTSSFNACMVTDTGGIDDSRSTPPRGPACRPPRRTARQQSVRPVEHRERLRTEHHGARAKQNCNIDRHGRRPDGPATTNAAKANPSQHFAIVDNAGNGTNIQGLQFNTAQAGFLAGYLAAGYSKTGKVATFGGQKIAPRDHLHGRLLGGRAVLQQAEQQERPGARLGREVPERELRQLLHRPDQGPQLAKNFIQARAPT